MEDKLKQLGINCPDCNSFIYTPLDQILFGNQFECTDCSLIFAMNKTSADQVLKQLQDMDFVF